MCGGKYWELYIVLSYPGVVYLLYRLYCEWFRVLLLVVCVYFCNCIVCNFVSCLVCIVVVVSCALL
jgi:hypothetical protein